MNVEQAYWKLKVQLDCHNDLPNWCNAFFFNPKRIEIWIDPSATQLPSIPNEIDGVPVHVKIKGPGQAC